MKKSYRQLITKDQRKALFAIYTRILQFDKPVFAHFENGRVVETWIRGDSGKFQLPQYRQWRKKFRFIAEAEYIMIPFGSMLLGIERDGHTHS